MKLLVQLKAYMDRIGQTGKARENVLGKASEAPLHLHKSLIYRSGAGNENRTRIASLEGWSFTIKLCPRVMNGWKSCHEVGRSQAVFSAQITGRAC
jgi:hypothetical protein